jgi:hypothetical protein
MKQESYITSIYTFTIKRQGFNEKFKQECISYYNFGLRNKNWNFEFNTTSHKHRNFGCHKHRNFGYVSDAPPEDLSMLELPFTRPSSSEP